MLASKRFRNASNQSPFLAFAAKRALDGKMTPGHVVAKALFPRKAFKIGATDVRVTAGNLRSTLKKYYAREGCNDLVLISLPDPPPDKSVKLKEGEAYTPEFSYNPNHASAREFTLGEFYLRRGLFTDVHEALAHFNKVIALAPTHMGAILGAVDAICDALHYWERHEDRGQWIAAAHGFIERALDLSPRFWRVHSAKGNFLMRLGDLVAAEAAFKTSLELDRSSTEGYLQYSQFLAKVGRFTESLRLAKAYLDSHVDDVNAYTLYAAALCDAGQLVEAEQVLTTALHMDKSRFSVHLGFLLLYFKQDRPAEAKRHAESLRHLVDEATYERIMIWLRFKFPPP